MVPTTSLIRAQALLLQPLCGCLLRLPSLWQAARDEPRGAVGSCWRWQQGRRCQNERRLQPLKSLLATQLLLILHVILQAYMQCCSALGLLPGLCPFISCPQRHLSRTVNNLGMEPPPPTGARHGHRFSCLGTLIVWVVI